MSRITIADLHEIIRDSLPLAAALGFEVENIEPGRAVVRLPFKRDWLRPGGTLARPALMAVADFAMYVVVMCLIGRVEAAVTTHFNINFLRRPGPADIRADGGILKLGKRLAVLEVGLYSVGEDELVAHATGTYSIPPEPRKKSPVKRVSVR
ncbi:MAG: PaaI family thioesterase [Pseudomonadota bacterium]